MQTRDFHRVLCGERRWETFTFLFCKARSLFLIVWVIRQGRVCQLWQKKWSLMNWNSSITNLVTFSPNSSTYWFTQQNRKLESCFWWCCCLKDFNLTNYCVHSNFLSSSSSSSHRRRRCRLEVIWEFIHVKRKIFSFAQQQARSWIDA